MPLDEILLGDCLEGLRTLPSRSVNLVVTSPPYADNRKKASSYVGVEVDDYVDWFLPITAQLRRVLKSDGSVLLNIEPVAVDGTIPSYVNDLVNAMSEQGWHRRRDFFWFKPNPMPGLKVKNAVEHIYHFTAGGDFKFRPNEVMVPRKAKKPTKIADVRVNSRSGSGFGKNNTRCYNDIVCPTNVIEVPVGGAAIGLPPGAHPAVFPVGLPAWFIKLFSDEKDVVLDPFSGSGTTAVAAAGLGRHYVSFEMSPEYCSMAQQRLSQDPEVLKQQVEKAIRDIVERMVSKRATVGAVVIWGQFVHILWLVVLLGRKRRRLPRNLGLTRSRGYATFRWRWTASRVEL